MMCKAALMNDAGSFQALLAEEKPYKVKKLGRGVYPFVEAAWQANILEIAVEVAHQKFTKSKSSEDGGLLKDRCVKINVLTPRKMCSRGH